MLKIIKKWFGPSQEQKEAETLKTGEEFGEQTAEKIETIGREILDKKVDLLLTAFSERLDDADGNIEMVAAHFQVFKEKTDEIIENMWEVVQIQLEPEIKIAEQLEIASAFAELVNLSIDPRIDRLVKGAISIYEAKLDELSKT